MSGNDSLSCINSLVTKMIVINHRNIQPWPPAALMWRQVMGGGAGPRAVLGWLIANSGQWMARSFTMPKWRAAAGRDASAPESGQSASSSRGRHGAITK